MNVFEEEALSAYLDGEADIVETRRVERRLKRDPEYSRHFEAMRAEKRARLASFDFVSMPPSLRASLLRNIPDIPPEPERRWGGRLRAAFFRPLVGYALAAAACVAVTLWAKQAGLFLPRVQIPEELFITAHQQYALTSPLAQTERIMTEMPGRLSAGNRGDPDVY